MSGNKTKIYKDGENKKVSVCESIESYWCPQIDKKSYLDKVFYKDARNMEEVPDSVVDLILTSPPYFNIKDYSKDGWQKKSTFRKNTRTNWRY